MRVAEYDSARKEVLMSENRFYTISKWKKFDNYECRHCPFATLDRKVMTAHIQVHIRGNPKLAGMEVPAEVLPEVSEDHGLGDVDNTKDDPPADKKKGGKKETYKPNKKGKGKGEE